MRQWPYGQKPYLDLLYPGTFSDPFHRFNTIITSSGLVTGQLIDNSPPISSSPVFHSLLPYPHKRTHNQTLIWLFQVVLNGNDKSLYTREAGHVIQSRWLCRWRKGPHEPRNVALDAGKGNQNRLSPSAPKSMSWQHLILALWNSFQISGI
jgi:hypothetical protein